MKLLVSWLREFVSVEADAGEIARRLTLAGLEVENVERTAATFDGVFVAKVIDVKRHPNADRLNLCEVDPGDGARLEIVCGAPNVKAGMMIALARVGARLGAIEKQQQGGGGSELANVRPLEAAVIRGIQSEGMICSERELGISDEHSGIMDLGADAPLGTSAAEFLELEDTVLDVAVLPNRGDCLSIFGLAREVAALFGTRLKPLRLRSTRRNFGGGAAFNVEIEATDLCPRYAALAMTGVKLGGSPRSIKRRLELSGMRAINGVVDATNYVMLEIGQPLHAFDWEKITGGKIVVRRAGTDREFVTLDGIKRELNRDDLMIADGSGPLAIAGLMGGRNSEVGETTKSILLESAYFEPMTIAKTSRRLGLRSEASYRFERGVDRAGQVIALQRASALIGQIASGRAAGEARDLEPRPWQRRNIALDLDRMGGLLGVDFGPLETKRRLIALGAQVSRSRKGRFNVVPPSHRSDLNDAADLAEEVARITGLSEIPAKLPARNTAATDDDPRRRFFKLSREVLIGCGLTEIKTVAFIAPADNARYPGLGSLEPAILTNPLSAELSELRRSLIPGLAAALRFNLNREAQAFHGFEIAKTFAMQRGTPVEQERVAGITYGRFVQGELGSAGLVGGFFTLKGVLEAWLGTLGMGRLLEFERAPSSEAPYLHPGKSASVMIEGALLGYIGELHPTEAQRLELRAPCATFELDLGRLLTYDLSPRSTLSIAPPPRFPAVTRDLAMVLDREFPANAVLRTIAQIEAPLLESVELFDSYVGPSIADGKKSLALSIRYRAKDRTLMDEEVNRAHAALVEEVLKRLGAELRQ
ncbi:MAG TPA: phenylalanine--tRNA ligase subunit beta [Candidatus Binataceae bacterium]